MKLSDADKKLLEELCQQYQVNYDKVLRLLDTIKEFEFKDRRTGIYDALKEIIQSDLSSKK
jgi:hypothetical protein